MLVTTCQSVAWSSHANKYHTPSYFIGRCNFFRRVLMEKELFFKNSCVRDKIGELIPVYHGTSSEEFTVFVPDRNMDGNDQYGGGMYFTTSYDTALGYTGGTSGHVMECFLNITNPLIIDGTQNANLCHIDVTGEDALRILLQHSGLYIPLCQDDVSEFNPLEDYLPDMADNPPQTTEEFQRCIRRMARKYFDPTDMRTLDIFFGRERGDTFRRAVQEVCGYDGIRVDFGTQSTYVAWFPEQIKLTTNGDPTSSPDIRM